MFSRALRPIATVAFQNGAKNFSTTPEVKIDVQNLVLRTGRFSKNFGLTVFFPRCNSKSWWLVLPAVSGSLCRCC